METTAVNAYERKIKSYLNSEWFATLQDLVSLKLDPIEMLQNEFGSSIMAAVGEARQKILSEILQKEIDKLKRQLVIDKMVKSKKIGRHKDMYLHRDVITGSWKTVAT